MRFPGRHPSARLRRSAAFSLLAALFLAPTAALNAAPPLPAPAQVVLKGGHILRGTVIRSVKVEGKPFSVIQTDFGEILAPQSEITGTVPAVEAGDTFLAGEVRIVRLAGTVERRSAGAQEWVKVSPLDPEFTGQPRPRILPGDTVRTGADGQLDVMLHRDAWVRLEANTEVEFSTAAAKGSLSLLRGATVQDVTGRPRGQTFRVTTPSTTLGVRGTRFSVYVDAEKQGVAVLKGVVRVGATTDVAAGQEGTWTEPATVTVSPLSEERRRRLDVKVVRMPVDDMAFVPAGQYFVGFISEPFRDKQWLRSLAWPTRELYFDIGPGLGFGSGGNIRLGPYLIDRREVTRGEFGSFLEAVGEDASGVGREPPEREREPVTEALPHQAAAFAQWCGKQLPMATQWHVAGRGQAARLFPWGSEAGKEDTKLVFGSWRVQGAPPLKRSVWSPPDRLPDVDAVTRDTSQFGVRALVSSAPEWARRGIGHEPILPFLQVDQASYRNDTKQWIVCGWGASLFQFGFGVHLSSESKFGFRCVLELGETR